MDHSGHDHAAHMAMMNSSTTASSGMMTGGHDMHAGHDMSSMPGGHDMSSMPGGHDMSSMGGHSMDMAMYFTFSETATILFKPWKTTSAGGMVASCIGIFLLAMVYEGLKYYREFLFRRQYSSTRYSNVNLPADDTKVVMPDGLHSLSTIMLSGPHILQTCLHMLQVTLSYFLMLIFMTYNVWLCIAVVLGAGFGFFLFGWRKAMVVDITEHCH